MTKTKTQKERTKLVKAVQALAIKPKTTKSKKKKTKVGIKGHGDYTMNSGLGAKLGSMAGGFLGNAAENALRTAVIAGCGDYKVSSNTLVNGSSGGASDPPSFSKAGRRGTRVIEREYICDIISSATANQFNNQTFRLNAADPITFPWLTTLAQQFEEYQLNGLVFEFRSTSSAFNGTGQSLGTVILATDYNALDQPATSKLQLENYDYANSCSTDSSALHGIECMRNETPFPVLYTAVYPPSEGDLKTYDLGLFQVATFGVNAANVNLGELWVSYDVTFYKKEIEAGQIGVTIPATYIVSDTSTATTSNNYGNRPQVIGNMPVTIVGNQVFFPPTQSNGYFNVKCYVEATGVGTITTGTLITVNNMTVGNSTSNYWNQLPIAVGYPGVGMTTWSYYGNGQYNCAQAQQFYCEFMLHITAQKASMIINPVSGLTSSFKAFVLVIQQVQPPASVPSAVLGQ